ncbi:MAG: DUF2752 domain-containing protein [Anaerolineae bacterium]|nr:DUF2752 domain-containing protein [Anaerolineae bacterium]
MQKQLFVPVLASLLQRRLVALLLVGIALLQLVLVSAGLDGWQCPIKAALHIPCPGCGLSGAMVLLLRGQWADALSRHAFAPLFLLVFAVMAVVSALPAQLHQKTVRWIETMERRTGITAVFLSALLVYWVVRLVALL